MPLPIFFCFSAFPLPQKLSLSLLHVPFFFLTGPFTRHAVQPVALVRVRRCVQLTRLAQTQLGKRRVLSFPIRIIVIKVGAVEWYGQIN